MPVGVRVVIAAPVVALAILVATAGPGPAGAASDAPGIVAPTRSCGPGGTPAVIGRRLRCLRVGARCTSADEPGYRRYGFTCDVGTLRRA